ncbi:MAG: threonine--tRNA ligase [Synergistales bacterium]|nr:threonine--tRNA ligase [Synergistales bacterium]
MFRFEGIDGRSIETEGLSAEKILEKLRIQKGAIAVKLNGKNLDLAAIPQEGGLIQSITAESAEGLNILRHSTAHLMAQAVENLFPGARFGIGPSIEDGFYYDMDVPEKISEEDLPKIENEMRKLSKQAIPVERVEMSKAKAIDLFRERNDRYKVELIEEIEDDQVSLYKQGNYLDLCRGPHVKNTSWIRHFKLLSVAGAYWRGNENNVMLTRIYGTSFPDPESLDQYLTRIEEARKRDHRKIGKELDLFSIQPEGPGFPFFHPKGMVVLNELIDFWRKAHVKAGYSEIKTPLILDRSLWIRSGHWDHYRENMYFTEIDANTYAIKPMNCPGGILVYKSQIRSYRDLPLRMAELGMVHRHEKSGVLHGLMRVRCFTQDDAHIYCTPDQVTEEIIGIINLSRYIYESVFGFDYHVELSTRPENAMGDIEMWNKAEASLEDALKRSGIEYRLNPGDGAFYGPKIDFHLKDCIGRTWQCGTCQLDFQMPERFDMNYVGRDGELHRPVMLHRTILGSLERFFGILIEHFAGAFPCWIAPVQVKILPVTEKAFNYCEELNSLLRSSDFRTDIDLRDEKLGKKIRDAQIEKIPYMVIIGDKEMENGTLSIRERSKGDLGTMSIDAFLETLEKEYDPMKD